MTEITTVEQVASQNGHAASHTFDDDSALLAHILSKKPAEKLVDVPEWETSILCRALSAETRITAQVQAWDEKTKRTDFRRVFPIIVIGGCYNPKTGHRVFTEAHKDTLMNRTDGGAIERLALVILRLSRMLADDAESAKKN